MSEGIDVSEAMAILSRRAEAGGEHAELHSAEGGAAANEVSEEKKAMGQTIRLYGEEPPDNAAAAGGCGCGEAEHAAAGAPTRSASDDCHVVPVVGQGDVPDEAAEDRRKALQEESRSRRAKMRSHLETLGVRQLLFAVLEAQRERAATYQEFDRCLETVLNCGNITEYPAACARATASFSVLSDSINAIRAVLNEKHGRKDLGRLLDTLQKDEEEKLNATAALHLERIREGQESSRGVADGAGSDGNVAQLLRDGIASLRQRLTSCVERINDTLEEIRYAAAEEEDE